MNLKPPIRRLTRAKALVAVGAISLGFAGIGILAAATPALADPAYNYVAVGSDTTQDALDAFADELGFGTLGSFDAVQPITQTPDQEIAPAKVEAGGAQQDCDYTRPNGGTQGVNALIKSIDPSTSVTQLPFAPQQGCIDIARQANGPGSNQSNSGQLVYIPFALDGVAGTTGPATAETGVTITLNNGTTESITMPATNITTAADFTFNDLVTLYKNCGTVTEGGITYNPGTATTGQQQIDLYVPQSGSGILSFWASTLGFSSSSLPSCLHQTIVNSAAAGVNGQMVEQNDGLPFSDPDGFGPFSVAQYISQSHGHDSRLYGAVVQPLIPCSSSTSCSTTAVSPLTASNTLNALFPITHEVYNVVQYSRVVNSTGDTSFDPNLAALFVGTTSALCESSGVITAYGFLTLPQMTASGVSDSCGSTANSLRGFATV
jgi:hypothetical protein